MRIRSAVLAGLCALVPAAAALAAPAVVSTSTTVARYTFEGTTADLSGRGMTLRVRAADGGTVRYVPHGTGRAVAFPARCRTGVTTCPRAILEGGDDADLDPGTRAFRFGATVRATPEQVGTGANVMQKGVATTESQWKLQVGQRGRPSCVLVGRGSTRIYLVRATVRVTDGAWHAISCRRSGTSLSIAVDGTTRGTTVVPSTVNIGNTLPLRLGGRNLTTRSDQFGGAIDDVYAVLG